MRAYNFLMTTNSDTDTSDRNEAWLAACPRGEARTYCEDAFSWTVDRRPVGISLRGGASAVQTVCVTESRETIVDAPAADSVDAPLLAAFKAIQALAPDPKDSQSFGAYQLACRDLVSKL